MVAVPDRRATLASVCQLLLELRSYGSDGVQMLRLTADTAPPWHTLDLAHPGGLILFDCGQQLAYQRVLVTTQDVPVELRCSGCEAKRIAAEEFWAAGRDS